MELRPAPARTGTDVCKALWTHSPFSSSCRLCTRRDCGPQNTVHFALQLQDPFLNVSRMSKLLRCEIRIFVHKHIFVVPVGGHHVPVFNLGRDSGLPGRCRPQTNWKWFNAQSREGSGQLPDRKTAMRRFYCLGTTSFFGGKKPLFPSEFLTAIETRLALQNRISVTKHFINPVRTFLM